MFSNLPFQVMKVWLLKLLQDVQKENSIFKNKTNKKKKKEEKIIRIIITKLRIYFEM